MTDVIVCDTDKCTGCRICVYICAAVNEGRLNPRLARIKTIRIDPVFDIALSCRKCEKPGCLNACARNAISQDKDGIISIDPDRCDGCGYCVHECKYGVISLSIDKKAALVCDLCRKNNEGKPACVDYCPTEALKCLPLHQVTGKSGDLHRKLQDL